MNWDTLINLIVAGAFALIGLTALVGAIFLGAWWHFVTSVICLLGAWVLYRDEEYDMESVQSFFKRKLNK